MTMRVLLLTVLLAASAQAVLVDFNRVAFVINSQPNEFHESVALATKDDLLQKLRDHGVERTNVLLAHQDLPLHGAWTYFPMMEALSESHGKEMTWFVFLEENAVVDLAVLKEVLSPHYPDQEIFIGHALTDESNVIIHHYDTPSLAFPHLGAGFIMSFHLVNEVAKGVPKIEYDATRFPKDFSIDASYELSKVIYRYKEEYGDNGELKEPGLRLIHEKRLCTESGSNCAVFPRPVLCNATANEILELAKATFFAVKTCSKFHSQRLPIVTDTWAKAALNIKYFSEEEDPKYGTETLPGVKNTERGHCKKTTAIIHYFNAQAQERGWKWLVIADDDTIIGVRKLMEMLKCYESSKVVALGQRYGFRIATGKYGYDYLTGGGGMVLSVGATRKLMKEPIFCTCPKDDHPDDMHLGACMANIGASVVHSAKFHQSRPEDYHSSLLTVSEPVSFHKYPQKASKAKSKAVYQQWFQESDEMLKNYKYNQEHPHQEL